MKDEENKINKTKDGAITLLDTCPADRTGHCWDRCTSCSSQYKLRAASPIRRSNKRRGRNLPIFQCWTTAEERENTQLETDRSTLKQKESQNLVDIKPKTVGHAEEANDIEQAEDEDNPFELVLAGAHDGDSPTTKSIDTSRKEKKLGKTSRVG